MVKRSAAIAIANMLGNTASIYGSYMYPSSAAPRYLPGGSADTAICLLVAALALLLRWVHIRENAKLAAAEQQQAEGQGEEGGADGGDGQAQEDRRPMGFRYVY